MQEKSPPDSRSATDPNQNAVIHAAAGTGKTWLLVGRMVRLLLNGARPGSILAITFTRKAAAEIQLRLRQQLLAMCEANDADLARRLQALGASSAPADLARARRLYEELLIAPHELRATTFHAFCQELLSRFPLEAGVAPGFELIEQTADIETAAWRALEADVAERGGVLDRAIDELLEECNGLNNTRRALTDFLVHRSDWWAFTEDQSDPVAFATRTLQQELGIDPERDPIQQLAADRRFREQVAAYLRGFNGQPAGRHQANLDCLQQALAPDLEPLTFYQLLRRAFLKVDGEPRIFAPTKALTQTLGAATIQILLEQHGQILDQIQATADQQCRHKTLSRSIAWYRLGERLLQHYQQLKHEQDLLDFADLEWLTYRMISRSRHAEWVQYKLDQRIDHLLVDEFQDTNPTQWRLLLPLLQEMAAGSSERQRSIFLVGDEKQSIYRFRRADPELLGVARDWLREHTSAQVFEQHISWRSSPAIIEFVNLMFNEPSVDGFVLKDFRSHETHHLDQWGHVEVLPLIARAAEAVVDAAPFRNPLQQPRVLEEDQRHQHEGKIIATRIQSLIGQTIPDRGKARAIGYGDIIVLLRDRTHVRAYETALRDAHIPYVGAGRGTFLDGLEVRDIVQLLTLLITPFDNLALATVLRSPIFGASNDDLMALAELDPDRSWYDRLLESAGNLEDASAPLARAARLLPQWRQRVDRIPVHDLLDRIYYETNLPERYHHTAPPHLRQRTNANLVRLLELALELDSGRFPSVAQFLSRLAALTADDSESFGTSDAGDQVRILTIHAAKGLESSIVFLANCARNAGSRERGVRALVEWPIDDARPRHFLLTAAKDNADRLSCQALERQAAAALREEANLLYVAVTRARHMLFVSGCEPGSRGGKTGDSTRGWYGFIERRLQSLPSDSTTWQLTSIRQRDGDTIFNIYGSLTQGTVPATSVKAAPTAAIVVTIDPALTHPFALKIRSSTIVQPSHVAEPTPNDDDNGPDVAALSEAKQRGIVIHRMLERLTTPPFDRAAIRKNVWGEFSEKLPGDWLEASWQEACAVIDAPSHRAFFDIAEFQEARNEVSILYHANDRDISGVIDRLIIRKRDLVLIDYKTQRPATGDIAALAVQYVPQLKLYAHGLRRLWPGRNLLAVLIFTASCRYFEVDVD